MHSTLHMRFYNCIFWKVSEIERHTFKIAQHSLIQIISEHTVLSSILNTIVKNESHGLLRIDSHHPPFRTLTNLPYLIHSIAPLSSWHYIFKDVDYNALSDYFSSLYWKSLQDYNDINVSTDSLFGYIYLDHIFITSNLV